MLAANWNTEPDGAARLLAALITALDHDGSLRHSDACCCETCSAIHAGRKFLEEHDG